MESGKEFQPAAALFVMFSNLEFGVAPEQPHLVGKDAFLHCQTFLVAGNKIDSEPFVRCRAAVANRCRLLGVSMGENSMQGVGREFGLSQGLVLSKDPDDKEVDVHLQLQKALALGSMVVEKLSKVP